MTKEPADKSSNQTIDPFVSMTTLAARIRARTVSPVDAVDTYLNRIKTQDDAINAYVTVIEHHAREAAEEAERAVEADEDLGPLHGVPIALKDLRYLKTGVPHSFGSKLINDLGYVAERTTADVQRLEDAGAVVLGKTNVPEFGHKGATDNEYVGATATPFNLEYNAGGSSGGSAAAVAAGMTSVATGSDSAGSIRIPAAACGVFGHKPSFGLIPVDSRPTAFGLKTHHSVQGPLTRTVEDAAMLMEVLVGQHPSDPASIPDPGIDFQRAIERSIDDLHVGYSPDLDVFSVEAVIETIVSDAVTALTDAGATVEPVSIDHGYSMDELADLIETTLSVEFIGLTETLTQSFGLDIREYPDQVSESLLDLLKHGEQKTLTDVAATRIPRTELFDAIQDCLAEYDLLVTPTLATQGMELHTDRGTDWELGLTWPFNWTGHPAASVPAGLTDDGLPVGMQIIGRRYGDDDVFAASAAVERERPWIDTYPR